MTLVLLLLGGTVTSRDAGLAVPDWPTSYGYNMFLFPVSMWKGGIFWEHTHRLWASGVGMMTIVLAVWLWVSEKKRPWLRWFGVGMLAMVIGQGILGGLRVTEIDWRLGIFHGIFAQMYLCGIVIIAAATGRVWHRDAHQLDLAQLAGPRRWIKVLLVVMLIQLSLGSAMRHGEAGLAIPDFPTFYGQWYPPMTHEALEERLHEIPYDEIHEQTEHVQLWQVHLHMAHRFWALSVVVALVILLGSLKNVLADNRSLIAPSLTLAGLLIVQLGLGVSIIWSQRHPEIATAHQMIGAIMLAVATQLAIRIGRLTRVQPMMDTIPTRGVTA